MTIITTSSNKEFGIKVERDTWQYTECVVRHYKRPTTDRQEINEGEIYIALVYKNPTTKRWGVILVGPNPIETKSLVIYGEFETVKKATDRIDADFDRNYGWVLGET